MREHRPDYIKAICEGCDKEFDSHKKSIGYASYCPDCVKKKVWMPSKGKQGKVKGFI